MNSDVSNLQWFNKGVKVIHIIDYVINTLL